MNISVDEMEGKIMLSSGYKHYIGRMFFRLRRWADNNLTYESRQQFLDDVTTAIENDVENKLFAYYLLIKQDELTNMEKINKIVNRLLNHNCILGIVGKRGSGKTYLCYYLAYQLHLRGEEIWVLGPPVDVPPFVKQTTLDIDKIPSNTTTIITEAGLRFFSRTAMRIDQIDVMRKLPVIRHSARSFIFETQNLSLQDVNFLRNLDSLIFKSFSLLQSETEKIKIHHDFKQFMPSRVDQCLYVDENGILCFHVPLESWWDPVYGLPYRRFKNSGEAYRFILRLLEELEDREIVEELGLKGYKMREVDIAKIRMFAESYNLKDLTSLDDETLEEVIRRGWDDTPVNLIAENRYMNIKGNFQLDPLQIESLQLDFQQNPELEKRINFNINETFYDYLKYRILNQGNVLIMITGTTGTGKSLASISLAQVIYKIMKAKFDPSLISFSPDAALEKLREAESSAADKVVLLEEVGAQLGVGVGAHALFQELSAAEQTLRKRRISFIYNSPMEVSRHLYNYILETAGIDKEHNLARLIVFDMKKRPLGYITLARPSRQVEKQYEKMKEEFMAKIVNRRSGEKNWEKKIEKIKEHKLYKYVKYKRDILVIIEKLYPNLPESAKERMADILMLELRAEKEN
jgi:ABC-type dipeptide/oligopeptide/nickel transport system ATPase component